MSSATFKTSTQPFGGLGIKMIILAKYPTPQFREQPRRAGEGTEERQEGARGGRAERKKGRRKEGWRDGGKDVGRDG